MEVAHAPSERQIEDRVEVGAECQRAVAEPIAFEHGRVGIDVVVGMGVKRPVLPAVEGSHHEVDQRQDDRDREDDDARPSATGGWRLGSLGGARCDGHGFSHQGGDSTRVNC